MVSKTLENSFALYEFMLSQSRAHEYALDTTITQLANSWGKSYDTTRNALNSLIGMGYVSCVPSKRGTTKNRYIIRH